LNTHSKTREPCQKKPFNTLVREKKAGALIGRILADLKPEVAYFSELVALSPEDLGKANLEAIADKWA
jgi:hypothetical protein